MKFKVGDRVRISSKVWWAKDCLGTISLPPEFAQNLVQEKAPWNGHTRLVKGRIGTIIFYWVWFDEPQYASEGDGPYKGSEIEEFYLENL